MPSAAAPVQSIAARDRVLARLGLSDLPPLPLHKNHDSVVAPPGKSSNNNAFDRPYNDALVTQGGQLAHAEVSKVLRGSGYLKEGVSDEAAKRQVRSVMSSELAHNLALAYDLVSPFQPKLDESTPSLVQIADCFRVHLAALRNEGIEGQQKMQQLLETLFSNVRPTTGQDASASGGATSSKRTKVSLEQLETAGMRDGNILGTTTSVHQAAGLSQASSSSVPLAPSTVEALAKFPPLPELHDLSLLRMYRSPKDPPSSLFAGALSQAGQLFITHVLQEMLISSGSVVGAASPDIIARPRYRQDMLTMSDHYKLCWTFSASSEPSSIILPSSLRTRAFEAYVAALSWDRQDGFGRACKFIKQVFASRLAESIELARQEARLRAVRASCPEPDVKLEALENTAPAVSGKLVVQEEICDVEIEERVMEDVKPLVKVEERQLWHLRIEKQQ